MGLLTDLNKEVEQILKEQWKTREGQVVPESEDLKLSNDAVILEGTVLYADLSGSTYLVDNYKQHFAAEIYKAYLHCAAKIIRSEGGVITAYDGDRVMAVYIGNTKNTSAVRTALKINYSVQYIIPPAMKKVYPDEKYTVSQVVGIDTSNLFIARTGIRGSNDLVWVGRAANHAAKLTSLSATYSTYITKEVYDVMLDSVKTSNGRSMWEIVRWSEMDNKTIYRSNFWWTIE
ncbi:MAG: adenylate/guanylate cyclase domain-containing protein [bacterium]|nr:adenylate/guanylate cyclase domain-containing protein [bacterium]